MTEGSHLDIGEEVDLLKETKRGSRWVEIAKKENIMSQKQVKIVLKSDSVLCVLNDAKMLIMMNTEN